MTTQLEALHTAIEHCLEDLQSIEEGLDVMHFSGFSAQVREVWVALRNARNEVLAMEEED